MQGERSILLISTLSLLQRVSARMTGWLRADGGPTLYNYPNRTPVTGDVQVILVYLVFATLFFAFVLIFPGIRKEVGTLLYAATNYF